VYTIFALYSSSHALSPLPPPSQAGPLLSHPLRVYLGLPSFPKLGPACLHNTEQMLLKIRRFALNRHGVLCQVSAE
jgi:hypothetical protein